MWHRNASQELAFKPSAQVGCARSETSRSQARNFGRKLESVMLWGFTAATTIITGCMVAVWWMVSHERRATGPETRKAPPAIEGKRGGSSADRP